MHPADAHDLWMTRRALLGRSAGGIGSAALASLLAPAAFGDPAASGGPTPPPDVVAAPTAPPPSPQANGLPGLPHFAAKAKRVIYLFQSGGPSQMDLFDPKPGLAKFFDKDLPDSVRRGQRITGMTSGQARLPVAPSVFKFDRHGKGGTWLSELLPHTAGVADDLCVVRSLHTEQINHDPAVTFCQTGFQLAGRPSIGSWVSYGLGSENENLPAFVVMISQGTGNKNDQPLADRQWGSGFVPSRHQGVKLRGQGDPVLYLSNPPGVSPAVRRQTLDDLAALNRHRLDAVGDPEIATRVSQYELAFKMQTSVPDLADTSNEPRHVLDSYGPEVHKRGSFAANCLLARRLVERGVRFVQLFHRGWDQHGSLPGQIRNQCRDTDQPSAALVADLKARGLLDDTLVVWGGEFGRTTYSQGALTATNYGRDHHPRCFSAWMAGGGVRGGMTHGETDDFSYNVVRDPVDVHDLHATILHLLGVDHTRLTYKFQGRHFRLTDVHGKVVTPIVA
ncbi:MAG: hypothetical protein JWO31_1937 [Phycisphaerales bacterium]|nr:hypothetical protein [Phycisphaerales bacterium]